MVRSLQLFTAKKLILGVLALVVLASASYGGWTLLSSDVAAVNDPVEPAIPVDLAEKKKQPVPEVKVVVPEPVQAIEKPKPIEPTPVVIQQAASKPDKHAPTGTNHDGQKVMLHTVMHQLHSEAYNKFINSPGFGMSRMTPTLVLVKRDWKLPEWTSEELAKEPPPHKGQKDLGMIHRFSLKKFADSNTLPKEQRLQAEFSTLHPITKSDKEYLWEIKSLDLVGLVVHENPVVYVSEKLPEMKDLKNKPVRELDVFEMEGIEELANGKELYFRAKGETIRVLGPLHASKACMKCHRDSKEGQMLGAFSYTLREAQYRVNGRGGEPWNIATPQPSQQNPLQPPLRPKTK